MGEDRRSDGPLAEGGASLLNSVPTEVGRALPIEEEIDGLIGGASSGLDG